MILCAPLWALVDHPSSRREWSVEKKLDAIRAADFDGVCGYFTSELKAGAEKRGLQMLAGGECHTLSEARRKLQAQRNLGVKFINMQFMSHNTAARTAAAIAVRLSEVARRLGLALHFETHRNTATETPEKFSEIAQRYRKLTGRLLPVTWDHSHFAVSKHLFPASIYAPRLLAWPRLIQHSQIFHLRPFNSQHCQIPVTDGRGRLTHEFVEYRDFVEKLFVLWLKGPRPGGELWACPEMGMTHGYRLSTQPPVWSDVVRLRHELQLTWRKALHKA